MNGIQSDMNKYFAARWGRLALDAVRYTSEPWASHLAGDYARRAARYARLYLEAAP